VKNRKKNWREEEKTKKKERDADRLWGTYRWGKKNDKHVCRRVWPEDQEGRKKRVVGGTVSKLTEPQSTLAAQSNGKHKVPVNNV